MKRILIFLFLVCFTCLLWAGGESEAAGTDRGASLVEQGKIIPADQIIIDSYISQIDYTYPSPSGNLGVNLYTGYKSRPLAGREEVLHIGIQARRTPFEELPVMNLAFVFDASGSMSGPGKMEYVREGLTAFVNHTNNFC